MAVDQEHIEKKGKGNASPADPKARVLMDASGCSEEEALLALEGAGGDIHEAIKLVDLLARDILVLKARLEGHGPGRQQGLVLVVGDTRNGRLHYLRTALVHGGALEGGLTPATAWRIFCESVDRMRDSRECNRKVSEELEYYLTGNLEPWRLDEWGRLARQEQVAELTQAVRRVIEEGADETLTLEIGTELITRVQAGPLIEERTAAREQGKEEQENESFSLYLACEPVIDPLHGRRAAELVPGNYLKVKVVDNSQLGSYLASLLGGREGAHLVPITAPVQAVEQLGSGRYRVELRLAPGVFGQTIVEGEVRIEVGQEPPRQAEGRRTLPVAGLAMAVLVIVFVIFLLVWVGGNKPW